MSNADNNILVVGNGFDLYHDLNTKYYDFVQYAKNLSKGSINNFAQGINIARGNPFLKYFYKVAKLNDGWIDCEEEIENVILTIQKLLDFRRNNGDRSFKRKDAYLSGKEEMASDCLDQLFKKSDVGYIDINPDFLEENVLKEDSFFDALKKELENLIFILQHYLSEEEKKLDSAKKYEQISKINARYVINFNYTDVYEKMYKKPEETLYIHGSLKDQDSIVLGIPDNDEVSLDFIYFKKYFQRIQKKCKRLATLNFVKHISIDSIRPIVYFLGLSMGRTDEDLIRLIIEKADKVIIYYYDQIDYEKKVMNLIDIYGREKIEENIDKEFFEFVRLDNQLDK